MAKQILSIRFKKEKNKLVPENSFMKERLRLFISSLPDKGSIDCIMELKTRDNTKAQLAKVHVCIKEIADEQGDSFDAVKKEIKRRCGMSYKNEKGQTKYESFADCSKQEMSNIIETIIQMGHFLNIDFRGTLDRP